MNLMIAALVAATNAAVSTVTLTSDRASYDRKEGVAVLSGHVFLDEPEYQLHADRAIVRFEGTNELKKVVALGHVAVTNGTRRAYGEKASYYRKTGLVVLDAGPEAPAEVRDEAEGGAQILRGKKIRFWTGAEQVEVTEAWLEAPRSGMNKDGMKEILGR